LEREVLEESDLIGEVEIGARPKPTNKFYDCNPGILEIPKQFKFRL
jgi:hypothetical protein